MSTVRVRRVSPAAPLVAFVRPRGLTTGRAVATWATLLATTAIALFPMYWLFVNALTPITATPPLTPILWPAWKLDNIIRLLTTSKHYTQWASNSLVVALGATLWHAVFDTLAGYAFAKRRFPGRDAIFATLVATLMVPIHVTFIPLYLINRELGLIDSLWAVLMPATSNVFGIFLMRQFIQTLPGELEDAARIDGCSELGVVRHVIVPLSQPAIASLAIFTFVRNWNDFLWPLIAVNRPQMFTLTVGVASLQGEFMTDWGIIFAGAAVASLPITAFFLLFQRYFLDGLRLGALK